MKRSGELKRRTPLQAKSPMKRRANPNAQANAQNAQKGCRQVQKGAQKSDATHHSAIRRAAEGELCTIQIAGICRHNTETTVLAHLPHEGGIMGGKVDDLSSAFSCDACHDVLDGRRGWPGDEGQHRDFYMRRAMIRTWRRLVEKGVIKIEEVEL